MIEERYCNEQLSRLLKEKGFREQTRAYYAGGKIHHSMHEYDWNFMPSNDVSAPTLAMAMEWLRERDYLIHIYIDLLWCYEIYDINKREAKSEWFTNFESYESCAAQAIEYVLTELMTEGES